jgi:hypothetical protein
MDFLSPFYLRRQLSQTDAPLKSNKNHGRLPRSSIKWRTLSTRGKHPSARFFTRRSFAQHKALTVTMLTLVEDAVKKEYDYIICGMPLRIIIGDS